jgi:hypothetical protein
MVSSAVRMSSSEAETAIMIATRLSCGDSGGGRLAWGTLSGSGENIDAARAGNRKRGSDHGRAARPPRSGIEPMTTLRDAAMTSKAWPFEEARRLAKRYEKAPPAKGHVLFETGYGPSGLPHIGTFGEVARTTMIRRAFEVISTSRRG